MQTPKDEGLKSLEKDLEDLHAIDAANLPSGTNVKFSQLKNGTGIAATLKSHDARYHKTCRSYCSSYRVKRAVEKLDKKTTRSLVLKSSGHLGNLHIMSKPRAT